MEDASLETAGAPAAVSAALGTGLAALAAATGCMEAEIAAGAVTSAVALSAAAAAFSAFFSACASQMKPSSAVLINPLLIRACHVSRYGNAIAHNSLPTGQSYYRSWRVCTAWPAWTRVGEHSLIQGNICGLTFAFSFSGSFSLCSFFSLCFLFLSLSLCSFLSFLCPFLWLRLLSLPSESSCHTQKCKSPAIVSFIDTNLHTVARLYDASNSA